MSVQRRPSRVSEISESLGEFSQRGLQFYQSYLAQLKFYCLQLSCANSLAFEERFTFYAKVSISNLVQLKMGIAMMVRRKRVSERRSKISGKRSKKNSTRMSESSQKRRT